MNLPVLNIKCSLSRQNIINDNGYDINPYVFHSLNTVLIRFEIVDENLEPVNFVNNNFFFGIDDGFNNNYNLFYVDEFNVDSTWDNLSIGRTSTIVDLRLQSIYDYISNQKSINVYAEFWAQDIDEDYLTILYQQPTKIENN